MIIKILYKDNIYIDFEIDDQDLQIIIDGAYRAAPRGDKFYLFDRFTNKYFHRIIMNPPKGLVVDHIDGNPMNNKRDNLRIVTQQQNTANQRISRCNTSGYKGVSYYANLKRYRAYINHKGKRIDLGYYDTAEDAARAYNAKALELNGEYARLNVLD